MGCFIPPPHLGSKLERCKWMFLGSELEAKVVSEKELKELFPRTDTYSSVGVLEEIKGTTGVGYTVYGRRFTGFNTVCEGYVAYKCNSCNNIVLGSPKIIDENSIGPLSGRIGYDIYCRACEARMDERTLVVS